MNKAQNNKTIMAKIAKRMGISIKNFDKFLSRFNTIYLLISLLTAQINYIIQKVNDNIKLKKKHILIKQKKP